MNLTFKKLFLLVNCTLVFFTVQAQNTANPLEDMVNAIKNDRVADMAQYFDSFVPITINNAQSVYSRNQAQVVLRDFLEKNLPKDFIVSENGSPDNTSKFMIGSFDTQSEKFNVYILMKLKEGSYLIQDFRINKE